MGAINYGSNFLVNLGLNVSGVYKDGFDSIQNAFYECEAILSKYNFEFYEVELKPGYYEGFYVDIEIKYNYFIDCVEKYESQRELTKLKKCLLELVECDLVNYNPGWCTNYASMSDTVSLVNEAIKKERERVKLTLTYKQISFDMIMNGIFRRDQL